MTTPMTHGIDTNASESGTTRCGLAYTPGVRLYIVGKDWTRETVLGATSMPPPCPTCFPVAADNAELRGLAEAATPGPWANAGYYSDESLGPHIAGPGDVEITIVVSDREEADAAYIAAANPQAVIGLLDTIDRLTAERAEARDNAEAAEELAREADTERKTVEAELAALRIEHAAQAAVIDGLRATVAQLRSNLADEQQRREAAEDFITDVPAMLDGRIDTSGAWSGGVPEMGVALDAIRAMKAELDWYIDRHGERAETEAEDAKVEADLARIDALSDDECKAELAAEGIDYDASRKRMDVLIRVLTERTTLRAKVMDVERERDELAALRIEHAAWGAFIDELRASLATVTRERDEAWRQRDSHARFLYSQGYTPCGIAACNCNSWHGGHVEELRARLRHVTQMLVGAVGAGGPMSAEAAAEKAVATIMERDELRAALETYRAALSARAAARQAVADWMDAEAHEMRLWTAKEAPGWAVYEASERALSEATAALAGSKP